MGMGNRNAANGSMIAGMGGFGCMLYNATGAATKYEPEAENRHIVAVQALTDTTIRTVGAAWDAPAAVDGLVLTAGNCLYLKAASVTISSGTDYPRMEHGDIEDEDIEKLANYIKEMTGVGILTPDSQLEDYVREAAHLPERLEDDTPAVPAQGGEKPVNARQRQQAKPQQQRSSTVDPGGEEDPDGVTEEDMQAVEEARKRLGRDP